MRPEPKYPNDPYTLAFDEGFQARREGKSVDDNPYSSDPQYDDELHFQWFSGFMYGGQ